MEGFLVDEKSNFIFQIQPQQGLQIRQEASASITQTTQQSHSQPRQQQYSGSSSLAESIAQVQKKMAEEKSVRLRKLLGLTVAIDQEKTKGYGRRNWNQSFSR